MSTGGVSDALLASGFHDAECAGFIADIPMWIALADTTGGRIVDLGAGTGRVTLPLVRVGHDVTAVDLEPALLGELARRAAADHLPVRTVAADMRELAAAWPADAGLADLIIIPMQTIQLMGGSPARLSCLIGCATIAAPGAELVISIVQRIDPFDGREASPLWLPPDVAELDGLRFESTPLAVLQPPEGGPVDMHRRRVVRDLSGAVVRDAEDVVITLDPVTVAELQLEAAEAGWSVAEVIELPETDEHAASTILTFTLAEGLE